MKKHSSRFIASLAPISILFLMIITSSCSKTKNIAKVEQLEKIELPFSGKEYRTNGQFPALRSVA
jgi:hypothetical protein